MKNLSNLFKSKKELEIERLISKNTLACDAALVELETNGHKYIGELREAFKLTPTEK